MVKNPPAKQEMQVQYLCWEDPREKGTVNHSSILAWEIPWTEDNGRLQSIRSQESNRAYQLNNIDVSIWIIHY